MSNAPEDFEAFWRETEAEARSAPLDYHRSLSNDFALPGFVVETFTYRSISGEKLHGWLAYPEGARRLPAFLWVPPYGRESLLPNQYGTRAGMTSLSINFHGHEASHQEKYVRERGYFAEGAESPETWIFRRMYQNASIAIRVLQAQVEVDEDRIGSMGMSQGAGISIWLGAWNPVVKAVCADMPFLCGMRAQLSGAVYRYPLKELPDFMEQIPLGQDRVLNTVSYYDTVNQAAFCKVPTQISLGLKDPAARPDNVRAAFGALPGEKLLKVYDWGHDWHPEMVESNREWLLEHF
ncbi:MAG TPA: acetylxylan esterase [Fimbriimonas sp.]|nr:acetylxylan esterase [Fimbriimonas sp.]